MKVIHIESGLGNQMLSYCEYLAIKKMNPHDDVYIENIVFDIPQCNDIICQWNGFELDRIFGISSPNIKSTFNDKQWATVMDHIQQSLFWIHNWNYPVYFTEAFKKAGLHLKNIRGDFEAEGALQMALDVNHKYGIKDWLRTKDWYLYLRLKKDQVKERSLSKKVDYRSELFIDTEESVFTGQKLLFKNRNSGIEEIDSEIRATFRFPALCNEQDIQAAKEIQSCNAVAIHARRGDMFGFNYPLYRFGYFQRASKFIKQNVENPVFFIFCDPGSVEWAKQNGNILGLDFKKDKVRFVDWNKGLDSYRDMQLMAMCKHQIITNSSFGWWGAWLNDFPQKITISPSYLINTTHTII